VKFKRFTLHGDASTEVNLQKKATRTDERVRCWRHSSCTSQLCAWTIQLKTRFWRRPGSLISPTELQIAMQLVWHDAGRVSASRPNSGGYFVC